MTNSPVVKNLLAIMRDKDLTQESFARAIGRTQGAISQWLSGAREPSMKTIGMICSAFGLTTEDIISDNSGYYAKLHGLTEAPAGAIAPSPPRPPTSP